MMLSCQRKPLYSEYKYSSRTHSAVGVLQRCAADRFTRQKLYGPMTALISVTRGVSFMWRRSLRIHHFDPFSPALPAAPKRDARSAPWGGADSPTHRPKR
eukprot:6015340-Prymnesium_polylepis.1